jgi:serine/threonine protein kinase
LSLHSGLTILLLYCRHYLSTQRISHRDIKPENIMVIEVPQSHSPHDEHVAATKPTKSRFIVQLADFGWAAQWTHRGDNISENIFAPSPHPSSNSSCIGIESKVYHRTLCGTPEYVPPEMLVTKPLYQTEFVDVWALGVLAIELVTDVSPFKPKDEADSNSSSDSDTNRQVFDQIRQFQGVTQEFKDATMKSSQATPNSTDNAAMDKFWDWVSGMMKIRPKKRRSALAALQHAWLERDQ